jgi:hypothetical protein
LARRSLGEGGKLACYLMRHPVNLSRLRYPLDSQLLLYAPKASQELDDDTVADSLEFLARVLIHISEPNKHLVHFYGADANRIRETYRRQNTALLGADAEVIPQAPKRTVVRL